MYIGCPVTGSTCKLVFRGSPNPESGLYGCVLAPCAACWPPPLTLTCACVAQGRKGHERVTPWPHATTHTAHVATPTREPDTHTPHTYTDYLWLCGLSGCHSARLGDRWAHGVFAPTLCASEPALLRVLFVVPLLCLPLSPAWCNTPTYSPDRHPGQAHDHRTAVTAVVRVESPTRYLPTQRL